MGCDGKTRVALSDGQGGPVLDLVRRERQDSLHAARGQERARGYTLGRERNPRAKLFMDKDGPGLRLKDENEKNDLVRTLKTPAVVNSKEAFRRVRKHLAT